MSFSSGALPKVSQRATFWDLLQEGKSLKSRLKAFPKRGNRLLRNWPLSAVSLGPTLGPDPLSSLHLPFPWKEELFARYLTHGRSVRSLGFSVVYQNFAILHCAPTTSMPHSAQSVRGRPSCTSAPLLLIPQLLQILWLTENDSSLRINRTQSHLLVMYVIHWYARTFFLFWIFLISPCIVMFLPYSPDVCYPNYIVMLASNVLIGFSRSASVAM